MRNQYSSPANPRLQTAGGISFFAHSGHKQTQSGVTRSIHRVLRIILVTTKELFLMVPHPLSGIDKNIPDSVVVTSIKAQIRTE